MFRIIAAVVFALAGSVALGQSATDPATTPLPGEVTVVDPAAAPPVTDPVPAQVAAVDPNAPLPTDATVVSQCTAMAGDLSLADPAAGPCITAAQSYIAALGAAPASLTAPADGAASARDAALSTLVSEIAPLTQDNICDKRDEELAAAVDAAAAGAEAEDTRSTLAEIARTIREVCTDGTTAAINDGSPADVGLL